MSAPTSFVTHLECTRTHRRYDANELIGLSDDGAPLYVRYDLDRVRDALSHELIAARPAGMWAWRELLPLPLDRNPIDLGQIATPLIDAPQIARALGVRRVWVKDEAINPTGSFKSRGMSAAVTMAEHLGARSLAVPTQGNAGGALAAYAAAAGLEAHIAMPSDVPVANRLECQLAGAQVELIDGYITDCGAHIRAGCDQFGWFDVSTLKEPYRIEGKKTMGLELAWQLGMRVPDVIIYPTGGGTGLIGMAKAFDELQQIGWLDKRRPRFVSAQAEFCCPLVRALEKGLDHCEPFENPRTIASGLRVPKAIGDFLMLDILRRTEGTAVASSDASMIAAAVELSRATGVSACPEGGACLAAARELRESGWLRDSDEIVLFNTATALKYAEAFADAT
jgi:threonine synthase